MAIYFNSDGDIHQQLTHHIRPKSKGYSSISDFLLEEKETQSTTFNV